MGTTTHQIEEHIERTRDALGANLNELEQKAKSATDWEQHFRNRPGTMLALAFGGGVVLAAIVGGRSKPSAKQYLPRPATGAEPLMKEGRRTDATHEAWDRVKGVVIGIAATRLLNYVAEAFPGFCSKSERIQEKAVAPEPSVR